MNRLYLIIGEEELLRSRALARIESQVMGEGSHDLDLDRVDGAGAMPVQVLQWLRTPPWTSPVRMVIMRGGEAFVAAHSEWLAKGTTGAEGVLVIEAAGLKKGKIPAGLKAEVIVCEPVAPAALPRWIETEARRMGISIASEAVFLLGMIVQEMEEGVLRGATTALEVLSLFAGGRVIDRADVENFFSGGESVSVFKWADTVFSGRSRTGMKSALQGLEQLLRQGEIPLRLIGLLDRHVKILAELHPDSDEKPTGASRVPPFAQARYREQARCFSPPERVWKLFEALAQADVTLKSLPVPPAAVMTRLVLGLGGYL